MREGERYARRAIAAGVHAPSASRTSLFVIPAKGSHLRRREWGPIAGTQPLIPPKTHFANARRAAVNGRPPTATAAGRGHASRGASAGTASRPAVKSASSANSVSIRPSSAASSSLAGPFAPATAARISSRGAAHRSLRDGSEVVVMRMIIAS